MNDIKNYYKKKDEIPLPITENNYVFRFDVVKDQQYKFYFIQTYENIYKIIQTI